MDFYDMSFWAGNVWKEIVGDVLFATFHIALLFHDRVDWIHNNRKIFGKCLTVSDVERFLK